MLPGYSIGSAFIQPMVLWVNLASGRSHPDAGFTKETETCSPSPGGEGRDEGGHFH